MTERQVSNAVHGAVSGPVLQVGTVAGDVNLLTGAPVRTRYQQQVKRIAPPELVDREAELAELAAFCTSDSGAYAWWRAEAWSGKSALMSTFVLNPPPGVRIVSFFVTARLAGQNDRAAFIDNLMEQLLTLLGESLPPFLTDATREAHLLGLLTEAAEACRARGEQFVLLVDGLDEDRGVHVDSDSYSIAALLPLEPPAGMRVMVAGRPNPPIPSDVPEHHPLRDPAIVRKLTPSPQAKAIRESLERELKRLLRGSGIEQDLLGLITAAGGGLTATDLSELTGETRWQIDEYMRTVTGRSFTRRDSHYLPGTAPDVYLLGHEELQVTAVEMLGPTRLAAYRDRLHAWARRHREEGWQGTAPEYLLRGYFGVLTANDDIARMIECATDAIRHDRLLAVSGSDATALAEIATVFTVLAAQDEPDLVAMIRIAMHRDRMTDRVGDIPVQLPALWASVGRVNRAETIAASIKAPQRRVDARLEVVRTIFRSGDTELARQLLDHAEADAIAIATAHEQTMALIKLVECAARCGLRERATALLDMAESAVRELGPLSGTPAPLMRAAFHAGDPHRAKRIAETIHDDIARVKALTWLARVAEDLRAELLDQAEDTARQIIAPGERESAQAIIARSAAAADDLVRAKRLNEMLRYETIRSEVAQSLAQAAAGSGDLEEATRIVETILDPGARVRAWLGAAKAAAPGHAAGLLRRAQATVLEMKSEAPHGTLMYLRAAVKTAAEAGELDIAESIAGDIDEPKGRALVPIVRAAARAGQMDRARRVIGQIDEPSALGLAWLAVARAAPEHIGEAEAAIESQLEPLDQVIRWVTLARVATDAGQTERAGGYLARSEAALRKVFRPAHRNAELAALAGVAACAGEFGQAHRLVMAAGNWFDRSSVIRVAVGKMADHLDAPAVQSFVNSFGAVERSAGLAWLTKLLLARGDLAEAERISASFRESELFRVPPGGPPVHLEVVIALVEAGELDRAESMWQHHGRRWDDSVHFDNAVAAFARAGALDRVLPLIRGPLRAIAAHNGEIWQARMDYRRVYGDQSFGPTEYRWALEMIREDRTPDHRPTHVVHEVARRCRAAHEAGDTTAAEKLLWEAQDPQAALPSHLVEPLVRQAIEIGDLGWVETACRGLPQTDTSTIAWMLASAAAATAADDDLVERILGLIDEPMDRVYATTAVAEADAHRGRYDRVAAAMALASRYGRQDDLLFRLATATAERGDYARALHHAGRIGSSFDRRDALESILDSAVAAGDLQAAAEAAQAMTETSHRVWAAAAVALRAVQDGDPDFALRMVDLVATPADQAFVWLSIAGASEELRSRAIVHAVRLIRWNAVVESVVEEMPSAREAILAEFEAVQD
ncbi:hypothetical protein ABZ345_46275 [Lentzea sp. NPDC005914]|uniref:hypothetical protein n=1 Tax=Lentzea sp. NPDC005914 TaxID=3154572 RepID=UPI0033CAD4C0